MRVSHEFSNPIAFEQNLGEIAADILSAGDAHIWRNQRLAYGAGTFELDFVFEACATSGRKHLYIFEFKYTSSFTLSDSIIFTQLARFSALRQANWGSQLRFLLVTNGKVPVHLAVPEDVLIFPEIHNGIVFEHRLRDWLAAELPGFSPRGHGYRNFRSRW